MYDVVDVSAEFCSDTWIKTEKTVTTSKSVSKRDFSTSWVS